MPILRLDLGNLPYLGAFALATDNIVILPRQFAGHDKRIYEALGVRPTMATVNGSPLIGVFAAGNSNGLVVTDLMEPQEEDFFRRLGVKVVRIPGKYTAIGNLVLANDNGAVVSPDFPNETVKLISEALEVPVERGTIAGLKNVGAAAVATNKGALVHPNASDEEIKLLESVLRVPVDVGTACGGVEYVGVCIIANSRGALVGSPTTGPELGRVESALGFI
ncbi:MAG: translation initiation factor IF-6 [Hadesarchaea archaeon]|nr:translation initiation factor IF-6 [Hadesarchaea archaeon]